MSDVGLMRSLLLIPLLLANAPASAQLALPPQDVRPPSQLAPIDPDSDWFGRLDAAGMTIANVLGDGPAGQWQEHFGGRWLDPADGARIWALMADESSALHRVLIVAGAYEQAVLGWQPPEGAAAYVALGDRPEADAIICWREYCSTAAWPKTVAEAENRQRHACVRLAYSKRFGQPQWRAFIDAPAAISD